MPKKLPKTNTVQEVHCPQCGFELDIQSLIQQNSQEEINRQLALQKQELQAALEAEKKALFADQQAQLKQREATLRLQLEAEQAAANESLQEELKHKSEQLKEMNRLKAEAQKLQREKEEQAAKTDTDKAEALAALEAQLRKEQQAQLKQREAALKLQLTEEQAVANEALQEELKHKSQQLKEMNRLKAEAQKLQREKEEQAAKTDADKAEALAALEAQLRKEQQAQLKQRETALKLQLTEEQAAANASLQEELKHKSEQLKELNLLKTEALKLQREKEELSSKIEAEQQLQFQQQLIEERQKIQRTEAEKHELTMLELRKQLEDQRLLTEEMKRKQEQGSMQLQGEAQELAIEAWLRNTFPHDTISEVKKGDMGADSLHTILQFGVPCGSVYYESKRTKTFQEAWIPKFKKDMMQHNVDLGVIVTAVYPKGMDRMGLKDGVYICNYDEFKSLCVILRQLLLQLHEATQAQENRGEKTALLYQYLTGSEFKLQFETIVSAFVTMKQDLESEKRSFQAQWKKREKQLETVLLSTSSMYGSIKGIAGNAALQVPLLEVSAGKEGLLLLG